MQPNLQPSPQDVARSNKKKLVWGLICLIGPSALLIASIMLYAIINFVAASVGDPGIGQRIINIILFLVGIVTVLTWLPGFIVGIILLASRRPRA